MTDLPPVKANTSKNVFMNRWALEPKVQKVWDVNHAIWFTLMGLGGAIFILDRALDLTGDLGHLLGLPSAKVVSLIVIAIGGLVLIADLGRPLHFWKAFRNVRSSWVSRGAWAHLIFMTLGLLLILPEFRVAGATPFSALPWDPEATTLAGRVLQIVTGLAAFVVVFYAGAVMARPRAIPYWNSPAIPIQFILSSGCMAMACLLLLSAVAGMAIPWGLPALLAALCAALLTSIAVHLALDRDRPGKRESIDALLRGRHRVVFVYGVVLAGTALPMVLALLAIPASALRGAVAAITFVLVVGGGFGLRLVTLRVGIFPPVHMVGGVPDRRPGVEAPSGRRQAAPASSAGPVQAPNLRG